MSRPLRLLLIEDSERDAALLTLYLRRGGFQPTVERIETGADMRARLEASPWDVIISDANLPHFGARAALQILAESGQKVPLLVVSGGVPPEVVDEFMKAGAAQYVLKDRLADVVGAIERLLQVAPP